MSRLEIDKYGNKRWYDENWQLHREDGPAVEYADGDKFYHSYGDRFWYWHGKRHREDGPAVIYETGKEYWYYNGKWIDCKSTEEFLRIIKLKVFW